MLASSKNHGLRMALMMLTAAILLAGCSARAAQSVDAMKKLAFLSGSWICTVRGGASDGLAQNVEYAFSPDGLWMTEQSQDTGTKPNDWAMQLWGYDANAKALVAYNFSAYGVATKDVDGWINGVFQSHRNDNGAIVSLKPINNHSVQWLIESADHSSHVREDCVRR